jgi:hypothetical protein
MNHFSSILAGLLCMTSGARAAMQEYFMKNFGYALAGVLCIFSGARALADGADYYRSPVDTYTCGGLAGREQYRINAAFSVRVEDGEKFDIELFEDCEPLPENAGNSDPFVRYKTFGWLEARGLKALLHKLSPVAGRSIEVQRAVLAKYGATFILSPEDGTDSRVFLEFMWGKIENDVPAIDNGNHTATVEIILRRIHADWSFDVLRVPWADASIRLSYDFRDDWSQPWAEQHADAIDSRLVAKQEISDLSPSAAYQVLLLKFSAAYEADHWGHRNCSIVDTTFLPGTRTSRLSCSSHEVIADGWYPEPILRTTVFDLVEEGGSWRVFLRRNHTGQD